MSRYFQRGAAIMMMVMHVAVVTRAQSGQQTPAPPSPALGSDVPGVEVCWKTDTYIPRHEMVHRIDINKDGVEDFLFGACHQGGQLGFIYGGIATGRVRLAPIDLKEVFDAESKGASATGRSTTGTAQGATLGAVAGVAGGLIGGLIVGGISAAVIQSKMTEGDALNLVAAFDGRTGELLWKYPHDKIITRFILADDKRCLVASADGTVCMLDVKTGEEKWRVNFHNNPVGMVVIGELCVVAVSGISSEQETNSSGRVVGISLETGAQQWTQKADFKKMDAYEMILWTHDGKVYTHQKTKVLTSLNADTGEPFWRYGSQTSFSVSAISEQVILLQAKSAIISLDNRTGSVKWKEKIKWPHLVWGGEGKTVWSYGTPLKRKGLIFKDIETGKTLHEEKFATARYMSVLKNSAVIVEASTAKLVEFPTGKIRWEKPITDSGYLLSHENQTGLIAWGYAMKGRKASGVVAVALASGTVLWEQARKPFYPLGSFVSKDKMFVFPGQNTVEVYTLRDGDLLGSFKFLNNFYLFSDGDHHLFTSDDGLWCLAETQDACPKAVAVKVGKTETNKADATEPIDEAKSSEESSE